MRSQALLAVCVFAGIGAAAYVYVRETAVPGRAGKHDPSEIHPVTPERLAASTKEAGGHAAPLRAEASDGQTHDLDELTHDRPLVMIFIKQGCPCSVAAQPYFNRLADAIGPAANVVGVIDGDPEAAVAWGKVHKVRYPILADPDLAIVRGYGAEASVYTTLVAPGGIVEHLWPGYSAGMLAEITSRVAAHSKSEITPIDAAGAPAELSTGCTF